MKKALAFVLVFVMMFMLASCSLVSLLDNNKVEITRGKIEGAAYTNELLGFTFTKPESWVYSSDEDIAESLNLSSEYLGEKFKEALENNPSIFDMMVVDSLSGTNINVGYENLSKSLMTNITVEQYIEALKTQLSGVSGVTVTFPDTYEKVTLGKTEFTKVVCTTNMNGLTFSQVYYLYKLDGYMCFLIATITGSYSVEDIENMIK